MPLEEALDVLFHRHGALVYRRALQLLGHPDAAEEAVQEVFIRAMGASDRFDPRARPSTWLYRITTNYCLNQIRDARRRRELIDARAEEATPASQPRDPARLALLRRLLAEADPDDAEAAVAVYVDGMSHAEAAAVLGVARRTIGNRCERFVQRARARLKMHEIER